MCGGCLPQPGGDPYPCGDFVFGALSVDNIELHTLCRPCIVGQVEHLEVVPATTTASPGSNAQLQAWAYYVNSFGDTFARVVTPLVSTWFPGDEQIAKFQNAASPNEITAVSEGITGVRATFTDPDTGTTFQSNNAALIAVTTSTRPHVLYAGWGASHVEYDGQAVPPGLVPSTVRVEARVADLDGDIDTVALCTEDPGICETGPYFGIVLADNGQVGDRRANDGTYTWVGQHSLVFPSCPTTTRFCDQYFQIIATDAAFQEDRWPYLRVGSPQPGTAVPGYGVPPECSERNGPGPFLHGVGVGISEVGVGESNAPITLMAYAPEGAQPNRIKVYAMGSTSPFATMYDDASDLVGDGLFIGRHTVSGLAEADYIFDFIPVDVGPLRTGDAYPRFRTHNANACGTPNLDCSCP